MSNNRKHVLTKLTLIFLAIGLIVMVTMTFMRVSTIDTVSGGGWGGFKILEKFFGVITYAFGFILLVGIVHSIGAILSQYVIEKESTITIIFAPLYIILICFYLYYVYNKTYDIPKYDLNTAEGARDQENEFIEEYKEIIKNEKRQPNFPSKEIVATDKVMLEKEIKETIDIYFATKDSLQKDSITKLVGRICYRDYTYIEDSLVIKYFTSLKDSLQIDIMTYSPDFKYALGMASFMYYDEENRPERKHYNTTLFIADKTKGKTKVYFYPGPSSSGNFFLRENIKIFTLASTYQGLYLSLLPNGTNISPLDKAFWNSHLFDEVKVFNQTYTRCQLDTSYDDTINKYKPAPYLLLK